MSKKRSRQGKLAKLDRSHRVQRDAKRKRKGNWAVRVWARKHIRGEV